MKALEPCNFRFAVGLIGPPVFIDAMRRARLTLERGKVEDQFLMVRSLGSLLRLCSDARKYVDAALFALLTSPELRLAAGDHVAIWRALAHSSLLTPQLQARHNLLEGLIELRGESPDRELVERLWRGPSLRQSLLRRELEGAFREVFGVDFPR